MGSFQVCTIVTGPRSFLSRGFRIGATTILGSFEFGNAFPKDSFQVDNISRILAGVRGMFHLPKDDAERFGGVAQRSKSHRTTFLSRALGVGMQEAGQWRSRQSRMEVRDLSGDEKGAGIGRCFSRSLCPYLIGCVAVSQSPRIHSTSRRGMCTLLAMRLGRNGCSLQGL